MGTHSIIYISPKIVQKKDLLLNTNSCAQCTARPNKLKCCSVSRERIIAGLNKKNRWLVLKNWTLWWFEGRSFLFLINFYWNISDLQCCINFYCTAKWISYMCTYILFLFGFPSHLDHHRALSKLSCDIQYVLISYIFYTSQFLN